MSNKHNLYNTNSGNGGYSYLGEIPGTCNPYSETLFQPTTPGNVLGSNMNDCSIGQANINGLCQSILPSDCNGYTFGSNCKLQNNVVGCGSDLAGLGV